MNKIMTIYKCPICGAKKALTVAERKNLRRLFCGSCSEAAEMREDRIEVYDEKGERTVATHEKPKKFILVGYDYREKVVAPHSASASKIYLPVEYAGKKIAVVLLEPIDDAGNKG